MEYSASCWPCVNQHHAVQGVPPALRILLPVPVQAGGKLPSSVAGFLFLSVSTFRFLQTGRNIAIGLSAQSFAEQITFREPSPISDYAAGIGTFYTDRGVTITVDSPYVYSRIPTRCRMSGPKAQHRNSPRPVLTPNRPCCRCSTEHNKGACLKRHHRKFCLTRAPHHRLVQPFHTGRFRNTSDDFCWKLWHSAVGFLGGVRGS